MSENKNETQEEASPRPSDQAPSSDAEAARAVLQLLTLATAKPKRKRPNQHADHLKKYHFRPNAPDGTKDERINRHGAPSRKPKSFAELRELAQEIAHRTATDRHGAPLIGEDGHEVSTVEAILLLMSKNKFQYEHFLQLAYGKVPDELEVRRSDAPRLTDEQRAEQMKALAQAISEELQTKAGTTAPREAPEPPVDGTVVE